jgi:hypothetical protein
LFICLSPETGSYFILIININIYLGEGAPSSVVSADSAALLVLFFIKQKSFLCLFVC